jgi:hypothetical protein
MVQHHPSTAVACKPFEEDVVLYYYGELGDKGRLAVEGHVKICEACQFYLKELESILPLTVEPDDPPQLFWEDYSREMRHKLAEARERNSWWQNLASFLRPWAIPACATMVLAILALTLTLGKGFWSSKETPQNDEAFLEILPAAENLEFFKTMEVLDAMDFLEDMGGTAKSST